MPLCIYMPNQICLFLARIFLTALSHLPFPSTLFPLCAWSLALLLSLKTRPVSLVFCYVWWLVSFWLSRNISRLCTYWFILSRPSTLSFCYFGMQKSLQSSGSGVLRIKGLLRGGKEMLYVYMSVRRDQGKLWCFIYLYIIFLYPPPLLQAIWKNEWLFGEMAFEK